MGLRDADRRKDEFLATLSHELRNPLAPIRTAIEVIRLARGDDELIEKARATMERQLAQLVRITDDLLDVARITQNKIELQRERIDLRAVLHSAVEATRPLIDAQAHALTVDAPERPIWVDADFTRIAQALSNLLSNAAKYTEPGGRISIAAASDDAGCDRDRDRYRHRHPATAAAADLRHVHAAPGPSRSHATAGSASA